MHPQIDAVPCLIIEAGLEDAAACFAAINGAVTAMTKGQMFHARAASGEVFAREIRDACAAANVRILKHKASDEAYRVGDTLAVGALEQTAKKYGLDVLRAVLTALTGTRDGHAGLVRADVVKALAAIAAERKGGAQHLADLLERADLRKALVEAGKRAADDRQPVHTHLTFLLASAGAAVAEKELVDA